MMLMGVQGGATVEAGERGDLFLIHFIFNTKVTVKKMRHLNFIIIIVLTNDLHFLPVIAMHHSKEDH